MKYCILLLFISGKIFRCQCNSNTGKDTEDGNHSNLTHNVIKRSYLRGARWRVDNVRQEPIQVYFAIEILEISKISPANGEFRLDFNLKQRWHNNATVLPVDLFTSKDPENTSVTVGGEILFDLWTPDAYIPNSRDAQIEDLTFPQRTVTIFKNGTIIYTSNMYTVNGCGMEFQWYPMETQKCFFQLESYSYTNKTVIFHWDDATVPIPVTFQQNFKLRQYILHTPLRKGRLDVFRFGRKDAYSRLFIRFVLERQLGHFVLQTFMPTCFIVSLSWFSFWLGMDAIPGRVSLLVTCMLTLVTLYTGQKVDLPAVSYVKMMDVWMTTCLAFVFAAMFEFIIVRYIAKKEVIPEEETRAGRPVTRLPPYFHEFYPKDKKQKEDMQLLEARLANGPMTAWTPLGYTDSFQFEPIRTKNALFSNFMHTGNKTIGNFGKERKRDMSHKKLFWQKIDRVARVAFPLLFFCFCIIFWPLLIFGDPKQGENVN